MKPLLLALLLAAACKHSSSASSSSHSETSTVTDSTSSETGAVTTTTTVTEQPGETTTTTEEFAPPDMETAAPEEAAADAGTPASPARQKIARHGPLVKRTVTVTKSGGEKTETVQQATQTAQGTSETHAQGKVDAKAQEAEKSSPALSCAFGGWLAIAGVVAALFGLGYFAIKRLRNPV